MHFSEDFLPPPVIEKAHNTPEIRNSYVTLADLEALCVGNEILESCLREAVSYSLRYAETVCRFEQIVLGQGQTANEDGQREEIERIRSTIHDSTIDAINVLSRNLKKAGKENGWISKLTTGGRAAYGKLAILLAFEAVLTNEVSHD
ncbi:MAG: hypothetical protein WCG07_02970 [Candidatus Taylorbacteria bacterium]